MHCFVLRIRTEQYLIFTYFQATRKWHMRKKTCQKNSKWYFHVEKHPWYFRPVSCHGELGVWIFIYWWPWKFAQSPCWSDRWANMGFFHNKSCHETVELVWTDACQSLCKILSWTDKKYTGIRLRRVHARYKKKKTTLIKCTVIQGMRACK